ncbi:MAG: hypothetical protein QOD60_678 [Solirubrobacterales bacterium]|nr:hypothetical protein [Solirubrobacterales bacterium]
MPGVERRRRLKLASLVATLALLTAIAAGGGTAVAKKRQAKSPTANVTVNANQVVPPAPTPTSQGILTSTAVLGKKFKGRQIDDVNVTLVGSASGAGSSIGVLNAKLTAPNGNTVLLFSDFLFGQTLGPLTLDDETPVFLNGGGTPSSDPEALNAPYAGKAAPSSPLIEMDGGPAKGVWTLKIRNEDNNAAHVHTLASWTLQVKTHAPFVTK